MFSQKVSRFFGAIAVFALSSLSAQAGVIFATNSAGSLLSFDSATPGVASSLMITGLQAGDSLVGIDFRPANSMLYGVGSSGNIYRLNTTTAAATLVAPVSEVLNGTAFGIDFNPVPDRIRIVGTGDQNLRVNPDTGLAIVDGMLAYAVGDVNQGVNPNVVAAGYTNSFAGAATTSLYVIDSALGILALQNPPNNGTLGTIGSLNVASTANIGFDIGFPGNIAYAALQAPGGSSSLYTINLGTGAASLVGAIGSRQVITGLAVAPVPEPGTILLLTSSIFGIAIMRRRRNK